MNPTPVRVDLLTTDHDLTAFACGNDELDGWLQRHALAAHQMDSARTFVLVGDGRVLG